MAVQARYHFDRICNELLNPIGPYVLYQVGDLYCNPGYQVSEHRQIVHEITYVVSGHGLARTNGLDTELRPGMVYLNSIRDIHSIETAPDRPLRIFYLGFRFAEPVESAAANQLKAFFERPPSRLRDNAHGLHQAFVGLFSQLIQQDLFSDLLMESYMNQIVIGVYRLFHQRAPYTYSVNQGRGMDEHLVYDVVNYLDAHAGKIDRLTQLGDEFGYSYDYLSQRFSQVTGRSLKAYATSRRFEKAKEYLSQGMGVTEVSELVGYKSIHSFSNAFKKAFGISPMEFQRQHASAESEEKRRKSV